MNTPTLTEFKTQFARDFPFGTEQTTVMDSDITKAMAEAYFNFNESLFSTQAGYSLAFMYLTAHYLVLSLRTSSQGLNGTYSWLQSSKSVGSISESFSIPQRIMDNPALAMLSKTNYGARYLSLVLPQLVGQVVISCGETSS